MDLETRLEKLEHEFKILKNEIQVTLLELQEQVLNRQYPALRATEDDEQEYAPLNSEQAKSNGSRQRPANERPAFDTNGGERRNGSSNGNGKQERFVPGFAANSHTANGHKANGHPTNGYSTPGFVDPTANEHVFPFRDALDEILDSDLDDDQGPNLREISLAELKRSPAAGEKRLPVAEKPAPIQGAPTVSFAVLADWVGESTHKLGRERTVRAVETYGASGNLAASNKSMIMQLIELAGEDGPAETPSTAAMMEALVKLDQLLRGA